MTTMIRFLGFTLIALAVSSLTHATIINVPAQYTTIQAAIDAATNGDTVRVAPGTYAENIHYRGKGITVASHFLLTEDLTYIDSTIIDGSSPVHPDTASCVIIAAPNSTTSLDTSAALIGFTITGGTGTKWEDEHGPGQFYREGGGVLTEYLSPRIRFNKIILNQATNLSGLPANHAGGGGLRCGDGNPRIENNIITYNHGLYGGGLVLNFTGALVRNNIIAYDTSGSSYLGGGGIWINGNNLSDQAHIVNNVIGFNQTPAMGSTSGGIAVFSGSPDLRNCLIGDNGGVFEIYTQSTVSVSYCVVEGGYPGTGNFDEYPEFTNLTYFNLGSTSPCIDTGDPDIIYNDVENPAIPDSALYPALGGLRNDMGVYGGPGALTFEGTTVGVQPSLDEILPQQFNLQSYPNPFNSATTIEYTLLVGSAVELTIYNTAGEVVQTYTNPNLSAGTHHWIWNGINRKGLEVASGVYLCNLKVGAELRTNKLVLIK